MKHHYTLLGSVALAAWVVGAPGAAAQTTNYAAGNQWGTTPSGVAVPGAVESAQAHGLNTAAAAAVNGASRGVLISNGSSGGSVTITSIGSQTIVSSSVVATGSTITSSMNATQTSSNTGTVTNQGTINSR